MEGFSQALEYCQLEGLGFYERPFTWDNNHKDGTYIEERLDRAVASDSWSQLYPTTVVYHLRRCGSDHNPIMLRLNDMEEEVRWGQYFKYEAHWKEHEDCKSVIKQGWEDMGDNSVMGRLRRCEERLKSWSKQTFGSLRSRHIKTEKALDRIYKLEKTEAILAQRRVLENELEDIMLLEELKWK
ncbi:unnamed protein product [Linum trigynum]|uniref:Uncharacterized protein n=1 Tax=Linum trigynum TaxID=586398 RepID=A0AAV2EZD5_9ROSI